MRLHPSIVVFASLFCVTRAEISAARIEFCKGVLGEADTNGDGFISYGEYHRNILSQVSPYERCPPANIFGVKLDDSYVKFHVDNCELCGQYDHDPQCCNTDPRLAKWKVPGTLYPDSYTETLCTRLLEMIDFECDDRPVIQEARTVIPVTGTVEQLRFYLIALIPLLVLSCLWCCILCVGGYWNKQKANIEEEAKSLAKSMSKRSVGDKDDFTEDPTETDFDLESPRSHRNKENFSGLLNSILESEFEEDYIQEFQPRAPSSARQGNENGYPYMSSPSSSDRSSGSSSQISYSDSGSGDHDQLQGFLRDSSEGELDEDLLSNPNDVRLVM